MSASIISPRAPASPGFTLGGFVRRLELMITDKPDASPTTMIANGPPDTHVIALRNLGLFGAIGTSTGAIVGAILLGTVGAPAAALAAVTAIALGVDLGLIEGAFRADYTARLYRYDLAMAAAPPRVTGPPVERPRTHRVPVRRHTPSAAHPPVAVTKPS